MSPLREHMIDAMQVRGLAARTQKAYVAAVAALARHYGCSPELLDDTQVVRRGHAAALRREPCAAAYVLRRLAAACRSTPTFGLTLGGCVELAFVLTSARGVWAPVLPSARTC
jgi:hypothetical protein